MSIASEITALQNDKTAIANAITAKGGTVTGGFDDFASDIGSIPSGGDPDLSVFDYSNFVNVQTPTNDAFAQGCTQKKIKVILPSTYSGKSPVFCNATSSLEEVEIETDGDITSLGAIVIGSQIKHIKLNFDSSNINASGFGSYTFRSAGYNSPNGCRIDGEPIDLSGVESNASSLCSSSMFYQAYVNYIRFKPNTLNMSGAANIRGNRILFDDDTIVSICNVLGENTTGSCDIAGEWGGAGIRNRVLAIKGKDDTTNGYHLFVKDDSGTLTLADWITNVKGWTLV